MPTFEITRVSTEHSSWTAKKGPAAGQEFHSYRITAKGPDGELHDFEINRKPSSGPPPLGAVEAEVQPSNGSFPDRLKLTPQGRSNGFKSDPERSRRIERQHSQDMAIQVLAAARLFQQVDLVGLRAVIKEWTDWFQADLDADGGGDNEPLSRKTSKRGESRGDDAAVAVSARVGFASDKQKGFFERLLKNAGLDSNQVAGILRFTEQLPTERVSKAIDGLNDRSLHDPMVASLLRESDAWARLQSDVPWSDEA